MNGKRGERENPPRHPLFHLVPRSSRVHVDGGNDLAVVEREGEAGESASERRVSVDRKERESEEGETHS